MTNLIKSLNIYIIKFYQYFISPILGSRCRYMPTCSEYYIESLKTYGLIKGSIIGVKRIMRCHPFKIFGGGDGLDLVPNKKNSIKDKLDG